MVDFFLIIIIFIGYLEDSENHREFLRFRDFSVLALFVQKLTIITEAV